MSFLKKLAIATILVFILLIAVAIFLPVFVDVNDYKEKIEQLAEESLGRKLTLKGDIKLKTFPFLKVNLGELSLSNPKGFPKANMLEIKQAEIGIKVLPLLLKKVEAGTIKIDSPSINLIKKSTGETNWDFQTAPSVSPQSAADNSDPAALLAAIAIQGFEIIDANISYADFSTDTLVNANNLTITTGSIIPGTAFPVEISTDVSGSVLSDGINADLSLMAIIDDKLKSVELTNLVSNLNQGESSYEINSNSVAYDIDNSQIHIKELTLLTAIDELSKAKVSMPRILFDVDQLIGTLDNIGVDFSSADLNAKIKIQKLGVDVNTMIASINNMTAEINHTDITAALKLPKTDINLSDDDLVLHNLSGTFTHQATITGGLIIPEIKFNKQESTFNLNQIQGVFEFGTFASDISGSITPLEINFDLTTKHVNLKDLLNALEVEIDTGSDSALSRLDLDLTGQFKDNNVTISKLNGKLDDTTINGQINITDITSPAYSLTLNLGSLAIDDYLPAANTSDKTDATQTAAIAAGSPIALSQFNINANLSADKIYSKQNNLAFENLNIGISPEKSTSAISLSTLISGEGAPESIQIDLTTNAIINNEDQIATLDSLSLIAKGKTINAGINIPVISIPFTDKNISVDDVKASFSNEVAKAQLNIPNLNYNAKSATLLIKSISGTGQFNDINAKIILPNLTAELDNQRIFLNELALDVSGDQPVGRLSIPTLDVNLSTGQLGSTNIIFEGQDGRAQANLKPVEGSKTYTGNIVANNFNLRGILTRFNIMTDLADNSVLTNVNLKSELSFSDTKLKLENIDANIDETKISGFVDAKIGLKPNYNFSINVGKLNADRYIPVATEEDSNSSTKSVGAPIAIPVELFQNTQADGQVQFDELIIGGAEFTDFNIGVTSENGKLAISPLDSGFFNGTMKGNFAIDSSTDKPKLDFNYALSNVALDRALTALGVTEKLAGNGNFSLAMKASGVTDKALVSSLNGNANIKVDNGTIKGVNIQDILFKGYQAYSSLTNKTVNSKYNPKDETEFSSMTGSWKVNKGVISGNDLDIQAPLFRINGEGIVSLVKNTIDYNLNIKVVKSLEGQGGQSMKELQGRSVPLKISGSIDNPKYNLDISGLVKEQAQRKAEEKIQEEIEDKLGEKLEGEGSLQDKLQQKATDKLQEKLLDLFN